MIIDSLVNLTDYSNSWHSTEITLSLPISICIVYAGLLVSVI